MTPSPPPAAPVGSYQLTMSSTGNNGELSGAVSSATSPKGGEGNVSPSWAAGPAASPVGEGPAAGPPSVMAPPSWCPSPPLYILQVPLPRGSPTLGCYLLIMGEGAGRGGVVQRARGRQDMCVSVFVIVAEMTSCPSLSVLPFVLMNYHP